MRPQVPHRLARSHGERGKPLKRLVCLGWLLGVQLLIVKIRKHAAGYENKVDFPMNLVPMGELFLHLLQRAYREA